MNTILTSFSLRNLPQKFISALWRIGENSFLAFLALLLLAVFLASTVFYRYVFTLQDAELEAIAPTGFRQQQFNQLLEVWEHQNQVFNQQERQIPQNIFLLPDN